MKTKTLFILFLFIFFNCKKENETTPLLNQEVLFEVGFINYAWFFEHHGALIDSAGKVWHYDKPVNWHFPTNGYISSTDMKENIQKLDASNYTINKDSLIKYFVKLKKAAIGEISEPINRGNDIGYFFWLGYIYDSKTGMYKEIILKVTGDTYIENKSVEAKEIYKWLNCLKD